MPAIDNNAAIVIPIDGTTTFAEPVVIENPCRVCGGESDLSYTVSRWNGERYYCESCYDELYVHCYDCGDRVDRDDAYVDDGDLLCGYCYDQRHEEDDDEDDYASDRVIQDYSCRNRHAKVGAGPLFLGVELEVTSKDDCYGDAEKVAYLLGDSFLLKEDGSLYNGFEIVSCPRDFASQKEAWKPFFKDRPTTLRSWDTTCCGMHVHVGREHGDWSLGEERIARMNFFLNAPGNEELVTKIAGRRAGNWCQRYEKKLDHADRYSAGHPLYDRDRYVALNLTNVETVEFRIFKGTLNEKRFLRNLEFVVALVEYCGGSDWDALDADGQEERLGAPANFAAYVRENTDAYPLLADYLNYLPGIVTALSKED